VFIIPVLFVTVEKLSQRTKVAPATPPLPAQGDD
jgi:hypothetical protein